ncbi:MAG: hypothetical protein OXF23_07675 [Candidatus Dadabacteria bacterium]|nr:hypothetical protein [Candidatus Dadabacteria bacterium]
MNNDLPESDHIVRYVKPSNLELGRVSISEFKLREGREDERGVSVNWLEYYNNFSKEEQLAEIRRVSRLKLRKNGRFAELNVGEIKRLVSKELRDLRIIHTPLDAEGHFLADPSHSEIVGLPSENPEKSDLIAQMIVQSVSCLHPGVAE